MSAAVAFEIEEQIVFKPIVTLTELWMKTVENTTRDFTVNAIKALSEKYNFPVDEAIQFLGLENTSVNRKPMVKRATKVEETTKVEEEKVEEKVKEEKVKKSPIKLTDEEKAEKKAKLEAERAEAKKLREEKEALEKAERAEKRKAELEAKKIEREEKQAKEKAEKEAKKAEEKAQKEAEKKAQKEAEKLKKAEEKANSKKSTPATSPTDKKKMSVSEITIDGKKYYLNKETKIVYDPNTKEKVGTYDETNKTIIKTEEQEEIEIEEN